MKIYSAYEEVMPLPKWLKLLERFIQLNIRLTKGVLEVVGTTQRLFLAVLTAFFCDFRAATLRGWTYVSLVCANVAMLFIAAVDQLHFSLGLSHESPARHSAFLAAAKLCEIESVLSEFPSRRVMTRLEQFSALIQGVLSLVVLVVALPYWLAWPPDRANPLCRMIRLAWSVVVIGLAYALAYIVVPALVFAAYARGVS